MLPIQVGASLAIDTRDRCYATLSVSYMKPLMPRLPLAYW